MDCLTYRRIKLAAPQDASHEVIAHAHACRECAAFTRQLEAFEQDLHATLHVPVSEGLAEKIILRRGRPQWFRATWLPVAAAIVIALMVLVTFNKPPSRDSFAQEFVNHVLSEPKTLAADGDVEPDALRLAFANFGGQLKSNFGDVVSEPIRKNVRLAEAAEKKKTIFEAFPSSYGAEDYARIVERILAYDGKNHQN